MAAPDPTAPDPTAPDPTAPDPTPPSDAAAVSDAGWPARPPRALTPRGVLIVIGILIFAVVMAAASVILRRTQLEKTTEFWGADTILALQRGDTMRMIVPADSALIKPGTLRGDEVHDGRVVTDLSGTPGLGHFRHALLDERHYDWSTQQEVGIDQVAVESPEYATIEIEGPPAQIVPSTLRLELSEGWVGTPGGERSVRLTSRVRSAVRHFLRTLQDMRTRPTR